MRGVEPAEEGPRRDNGVCVWSVGGLTLDRVCCQPMLSNHGPPQSVGRCTLRTQAQGKNLLSAKMMGQMAVGDYQMRIVTPQRALVISDGVELAADQEAGGTGDRGRSRDVNGRTSRAQAQGGRCRQSQRGRVTVDG